MAVKQFDKEPFTVGSLVSKRLKVIVNGEKRDAKKEDLMPSIERLCEMGLLLTQQGSRTNAPKYQFTGDSNTSLTVNTSCSDVVDEMGFNTILNSEKVKSVSEDLAALVIL